MSSPSIGSYQFTTMEGRLQSAASSSIVTTRGIKPGPNRPVAQTLRTVETNGTIIGAWLQAGLYRAAIGAIAPVVDDTGVLCPVALITDCRTRVVALDAGGGAKLETVWTVLPSRSYGEYGSAQAYIDALDLRAIAAPIVAPRASSTLKIAGLAVTAMTGDLQWPISESQRTEVLRGAKAMGADGAVQAPASSEGTVSCWVEAADDAACFDLMRVARWTVGSFADVEIGGLLIPGVAVLDVVVNWQATPTLPNGATRLAALEWSLGTQDDSTSGTDQRIASVVQVASRWGAWATVKGAVCEQAGESLGAVAVSASWLLDVGKILRGRKEQNAEPIDYTGQWCRILKRTDSAGVPRADGQTLTPLWWGKVQRAVMRGGHAEGSATTIHTCAHLITVLDTAVLSDWYEAGADHQINLGQPLPFNDVPGGDGGSLGFDTLSNSYIHDRWRTAVDGTPAPVPWTAFQIVDTALAIARNRLGILWQLTGQTSALNFIIGARPTWKVLDLLAELASPRWGISLRVEVTGDKVELRVSTGVQADTVIPGIGTLPANDRQTALLDLTGRDVLSYELTRAREAQVDEIIVVGARPWYCATFYLSLPGKGGRTAQFGKAWTLGDATKQEESWLAGNALQRDSDVLSHVWRRYRLLPDYAGGTAVDPNSNRLFRIGVEVKGSEGSPDATHGAGGETGEFILPPDGQLPKPQQLHFTRELPLWTGKDWSLVTTGSGSYKTTGTYPGQQVEGPMLFGVTKAGVWSVLTHKWQVQIEDDNCGIVLGRNAVDAAAIKAYLEAGNTIAVTVGVLGVRPWRASWRAPRATWPCEVPRSIVLPFPELQYREILGGTLLGLTDPATTKNAATNIRMDWEVSLNGAVSKLWPILRQARLWYEGIDRSFRYSRRGVIDTAIATAPGSMVVATKVPLDKSRSLTEAVNVVYTGRSWDFRADQLATHYTADRLLPGFDHFILAHPAHAKALTIAAIARPYPGGIH